MARREAFVSLATNDYYCRGALTLGHSIRQTCTSRRLSLLITNAVSADMRHRLSHVWDELTVVEEIDSGDAEHLALLSRPELGVTFSKLHAWRLTQYTKCVFLDADTLVLQNVDELFDREELSAAPDIGWPDCFNSGVFVFEPSEETFSNLVALACQMGSFDGGDQGLLNMFWSDWATKDIKYHLPFIYNVTPNVAYGYTPAYLQFLSNVKIVHFIGSVKPWQHHYIIENGAVVFSPGTAASQEGAYDFIKRWWEISTSLEQEMSQGFAGAQGHVTTSTDEQHRLDFQNGRIDYTGMDSFENIQQRLDAILIEDEEEEREPAAEVVEEEIVEEEVVVVTEESGEKEGGEAAAEIVEEVVVVESRVTEESGEVGDA